MPSSKIYHPSINIASAIKYICAILSLGALGLLLLLPSLRALPWGPEGLICLSVFAAIIGAWHDGHATGEIKGRENGSVIIWILAAIVLLAGLTAAMNQGGRSSSTTLTDQQARLHASEIIQYGNSVKQAVHRLQLSGISETGLGFDNEVFRNGATNNLFHPPGHNSNCTDERCRIFSPGMGGISPRIVSDEATTPYQGSGITPLLTWGHPGHWSVIWVSLPGVGVDDQRELILRVQGLKRQVCLAINDMVGVPNTGQEPPSWSSFSLVGYGHTPPSSASPMNMPFSGKESFCVRRTSGSGATYLYITSLIVR